MLFMNILVLNCLFQVACGEWVELDEKQVHRYCELLAQCLNNNKLNDKELSK